MYLCLSLLLLLASAAFLYQLWLLLAVHFSRTQHSLKTWWLANYKDYPARRSRCTLLSRWVQDFLFCLDKKQYMLNYTKSSKARVNLIRAVYCSVCNDPEVSSALGVTSFKHHTVDWDTNPRSSPQRLQPPETLICSLQIGALWALNKLEDACGPVMDCTALLKQQWRENETDCLKLSTLLYEQSCVNALYPVFLCIDYEGCADIENGIPAQRFRYCYLLGTTAEFELPAPPRFPPCPTDTRIKRGLGVRRVAHAEIAGLDVTGDMQQLCGPLADWHKSSAPLNFATLWFALWCHQRIEQLDEIVVEDSMLEVSHL